MNSPGRWGRGSIVIISHNQRGITYIEVLIVVGLMTLLGGSVSPFLSSFVLKSSQDTTVDQIVGTIRKAQQYGMERKDGGTWGICSTGTTITLFRGTCAGPAFSEGYDVGSSVAVAGLVETTFSSHRGEPSSSLSISVSTNFSSKTVSVNPVGGVDVQ